MEYLESVLKNPITSLFIITFAGLLLGSIRFKGITLGPTGVLIIALLLGWFGYEIPDIIQLLGLVIFIYCIGIQAGPGFVKTFKKEYRHLIILNLSMLFTGISLILIFKKFFGFSNSLDAGIFTGAFTNTAALATVLEITKDQHMLVGYGIVYPISYIGLIFLLQIIPRFLKINLSGEAEKLKLKEAEKIKEHSLLVKKFLVENSRIFGKTMKELGIRESTGAVISRVRHGDEIIVPGPETKLYEKDVIVAVGENKSLEKIHQLIGSECHISTEDPGSVLARHLILTNKDIHGKHIEELHIHSQFGIVITRIWRGGIEFSPRPDFILETGDSMLAVGDKESLNKFIQYIGKQESSPEDLDFLSMAFGIFVGIIIGQIKFPGPFGGSFQLGNVGGPLIVGLVLGYFRRISFLTSRMSPAAKNILRDLGLIFFMAGIGTQTGSHLHFINKQQLFQILISGIVITISAVTVCFILSYKIYKMGIIKSLGVVCGGLNNTAAMGSLIHILETEEPAQIYVAMYPLSLILVIIGTQVLTGL